MIHKIIGIVINDNKFLMVKKVGKDTWTSLGGRIEKGESEEQALLREIKEEIACGATIIRKIGDFEGKAIFDDDIVRLSTFLVELHGEIILSDPELEECGFFGSDYQQKGIKLSSTFENKILPTLIKEGLLKW